MLVYNLICWNTLLMAFNACDILLFEAAFVDDFSEGPDYSVRFITVLWYMPKLVNVESDSGDYCAPSIPVHSPLQGSWRIPVNPFQRGRCQLWASPSSPTWYSPSSSGDPAPGECPNAVLTPSLSVQVTVTSHSARELSIVLKSFYINKNSGVNKISMITKCQVFQCFM